MDAGAPAPRCGELRRLRTGGPAILHKLVYLRARLLLWAPYGLGARAEDESVAGGGRGNRWASLGQPLAKQFPFVFAGEEPLVAAGDEWWQPTSGADAEDWI